MISLMQHVLARFLMSLAISATVLTAADITGIWVGQVEGRRGGKEDVAFEFKVNGTAVTGKMFGDEFDLKVEDASVSGDQVKFLITTTNYYSGNQQKAQYTGTIKGNEIELTRTRAGNPPVNENPARGQNFKQTFTIKRITDR
jgi:hypothetical protein